MKNKFIAFSLAIIGICTVACRQSDENFDDDFKASKENLEEPQMSARDSTGVNPGDPPRNGTHWRIVSQNKEKENPKETPEQGLIVIKRDTINTPTTDIGDTGGGDPPRNGTHWRTK